MAPPEDPRIDLNALVQPYLGPLVVGLCVVVVILLVAVVAVTRRTSRLDARLAGLTRGSDGRSLEAVLDAHLDKVFAVARELDELAAKTAVLEAAQRRSFQRLGLVRYNPFEETGGNQSFALALLDCGGQRLGPVEPPRAFGDTGLRQVHPGRASRYRSVRRGDGRPQAGDGLTDKVTRRPSMVPAWPPSSAAPPTTVTRPRGRARREPAPLDQLPAWSELVPVMDPAVVGPAATPGLAALLAGLNPDQLRAVTHGSGPLLVVAGAGTGKTQVITRRIAWLIATHRAKPSEILALTFTDKAADEMAVRVDQLVPYGYTDTAISTFHAFGDGLIREYALELGLPTDLRVLSRAEVVIFLREHLFEFELDAYRPLGDPTRFLSALATLFSRCKDEDISPADYLAHADRVATEAAFLAEAAAGGADATFESDAAGAAAEEGRRQAELARAYRTYQDLLAANGCIDFGDQVALALRLVRTSPAARAAIAGRFRYILVDEFQDTNRAQAELVAALADGHRNVTVVGDDDQAIYAFRGAAIDNILEFQDRYLGARTIVLRRNYRSFAPILDAAYRLIRFNDPHRLEVRTGIGKRLRAQRIVPDPSPVRLEVFATGSDEADWIAAEIAGRIEAGAAPRDHAILVRANGHADPILRALNMAGIPWRFSGASGLYARPEVRLLLAFLRVVADLESSVDVYALAASEVYGLAGEDLTAIVNMARRRNRSLWAILDELDRQPGILRLAPATRAAVHRLVTDLDGYAEAAHEVPAGELLYRFLRGSGLLARLVGTDTPGAEEALQNIARLFEIVRSQSALLTDDRAIFVARHLATLIEAGDDPATAELDPDADAVAVLTIHKAKGLEFPVVFLPGMVVGRFPSSSRGDPLALPAGLGRGAPPTAEGSLAEERRLCYVAMTRARDELLLSHAADYGGARARRVSPFVLEALDLPAAAGLPGAGARTTSPLERLATFDPVTVAAGDPGRPHHGATVDQLRSDRRLPDLPAQVQVRPRGPGPAGAAPRDGLRGRTPQGRPALPSPTGEGPCHERDRA